MTPNISYQDLLPHNQKEERRLELQYRLLQRMLGHVLVHTPVDLNLPGASVLDSGTGSGVWLRDLEKSVPSTTELIGIDVLPNLFPVSPTHPSNLSFQTKSVLDLPSEWTNKFSLVHQQLLFVAFTEDQWKQAIQNIFRVLRPGGWLQMLEHDGYHDMGPVMQKINALWVKMFSLRGIDMWPGGSEKWKHIVEEVGFINVELKWYDTPVGDWGDRDGMDMVENIMVMMEASKPGFENIGGTEGYYDKLMGDLQEEACDKCIRASSRWLIICAQKPY